GDISFYEATGTTPKFFWDASAESLGIGTSSPSALLEVDNGGTSTGDVMVFNLGGENREHSFENVIATGRDLRLNTTRDFRIKYGADT
ncbi:hypothetical protein, partial [Klebsiella pneumoniae]|uniref:hypothetical protein n=1 Tax=Klebsiella pneumoniae TaxID=573 RepID=UPI0039C10D50